MFLPEVGAEVVSSATLMAVLLAFKPRDMCLKVFLFLVLTEAARITERLDAAFVVALVRLASWGAEVSRDENEAMERAARFARRTFSRCVAL